MSYLVPYVAYTLYGEYMPTDSGHYFDFSRYYQEQVLDTYKHTEIHPDHRPTREDIVGILAQTYKQIPLISRTGGTYEVLANAPTWQKFKNIYRRYFDTFARKVSYTPDKIDWELSESKPDGDPIDTLFVPSNRVLSYLLDHKKFAAKVAREYNVPAFITHEQGHSQLTGMYTGIQPTENIPMSPFTLSTPLLVDRGCIIMSEGTTHV